MYLRGLIYLFYSRKTRAVKFYKRGVTVVSLFGQERRQEIARKGARNLTVPFS